MIAPKQLAELHKRWVQFAVLSLNDNELFQLIDGLEYVVAFTREDCQHMAASYYQSDLDAAKRALEARKETK